MKKIVCLRHVAFEDAGRLETVLKRRGAAIRYVEVAQEDWSDLDPLSPDLLVVLGGPIGVYQTEDYPFLNAEIAFVRARLQADLPTIGFCLGSQIMAAALGARVYPGDSKEIGWSPLHLSEAGQASCLSELAPQNTHVLHWHGDTFDLPEGATLLASTPLYRNQAFVWGENALALQFHPEVTRLGLESWFVGHAGEIAATSGISVAALREQSARFSPALEQFGTRFFERWLETVGL